MKLNTLPHPVLIKLLELDQRGERLAKLADAAEEKLENARNILNGRVEDRRIDIARLRNEFDSIHASATEARRRANVERRVLSKLKVWIAQLPDRELEVVRPELNGATLPNVRTRLAAVESEIAAIESAPTPPPDLRERIVSYVAGLGHAGRPLLRGTSPLWPLHDRANRQNGVDFDPGNCNALLMTAYLFPDVLAQRL